MHLHSMQRWTHDHVFLGRDHTRNERRIWLVVALTAVMMVIEIVAGLVFGSMALLADGVHMMTHAGALSIAAAAYIYARRHAHDPSFTFGTGKVGDLASFASAIVLAMVALAVAYESVMRLYVPIPIRFDEAIPVAIVGLVVNLLSAWLLSDSHGIHDHSHGHKHDHVHRDHNLRSAYFHVLADAATSVFAIAALLAGRYFGFVWLDPIMGIAGAALIGHWAVRLMRDSGAVLTDAVPNAALAKNIQQRLEIGNDRVADLHLWRVGPGHIAVAITIVSDQPGEPDQYKQRLYGLANLSHLTVEVQRCTHDDESGMAA